jgi:phosphoribosylglycinamide formyltransferase-1
VPVHEDDDAESLRERIHAQEWVAVPEAVRLWCEGRIRREGRVVRITAPPGATDAPSSQADSLT